MRNRRIPHALVGSVALAVGLISPLGPAAADAPVTQPVITAPAADATVEGVVEITATSTAPRVQFTVDSTLVATVSTSAGAATAEWASWGWAGGDHNITAADCDSSDVCGPMAGPVHVVLAVYGPTITSPAYGSQLSGPVTFTATASGGGVAFYLDGYRKGFDPTAPYAVTLDMSDLGDGPHDLFAVVCDVTGTLCSGAWSTELFFTVLSLHPSITSQFPNPFSPNGDKVKDATVTNYLLPDAETVSATVLSPAGTAILGPKLIGTQSAGAHTWTWNGLSGSGTRAPDGVYKIVLTTHSGALFGRVVQAVRVDTVPATVTSVVGGGSTFYPVVDGFRDTFTPTALVSDSGTLTLTVRSSTGAVVRTLSGWKAAGRVGIAWNGRSTSGPIVAAGAYKFTLTSTDAAGNRWTSPVYTVYVSWKRLVMTPFTVKVNASSRTGVYRSGTCEYVKSSQYGSTGQWIYNGCKWSSVGYQWIELGFNVAVPVGYGYGDLTLKAYGHTHQVGVYEPLSRVYGGFRTTSGTWITREVDARNETGQLLPIVAASGYSVVPSSHVIRVNFGVSDHWQPPPNDFDLAYIVVVVNIKVLK